MVRHAEQGTRFGVALAQRCVAEFVTLVWRWVCLKLGYAALDVLIVSKDFRDSQRPGFVDCCRVQHRSLVLVVLGDADSRPSAMTLVLVRVFS